MKIRQHPEGRCLGAEDRQDRALVMLSVNYDVGSSDVFLSLLPQVCLACLTCSLVKSHDLAGKEL